VEATGFFKDVKSVLAPADPFAEVGCPLVQPLKAQAKARRAITKNPNNECRMRRKSNKENYLVELECIISFDPDGLMF
jgi:hypothetical protein